MLFGSFCAGGPVLHQGSSFIFLLQFEKIKTFSIPSLANRKKALIFSIIQCHKSLFSRDPFRIAKARYKPVVKNTASLLEVFNF